MKVLSAGEFWMTHSLQVKGFDSFDISSCHEGGIAMIAAMRAGGHRLGRLGPLWINLVTWLGGRKSQA